MLKLFMRDLLTFTLTVSVMLLIVYMFTGCSECEFDGRCDKPQAKPIPSTTNQPPVVVTVESNFDANDINKRLDSIEAKNVQQDADIKSIDIKLHELEYALNTHITDINDKATNMQSAIDSLTNQYVSITTQFNAQFNALWNSISELELTMLEYKNVSDSRYNELLETYNNLVLVVGNISNQITSINTTVGNHTSQLNKVNQSINAIQLLVSNITTNQLTVTQVQNIASGVVNGTVRFLNPCNISSPHTELVLAIGNKVYAYFVNTTQRGGLVQLIENTTYSATIGCSCSWRFNVVNNQINITKL